MTGRELGTALLIGAVSGVVVAIMAAALSGASVTGFLEVAPSGPTSPLPSQRSSPASPSVAPSSDVTPPPTARPTSPSLVPSPTTSPPATAALLFEQAGVKAGLPGQNGTYGLTTPAVARGEYISWRVVVGPAAAGRAVDVEVATRLNGTWTGWSKLTTRVVDADGVVVFSWRQLTPAWISVRFAHHPAVSTALQGRWR